MDMSGSLMMVRTKSLFKKVNSVRRHKEEIVTEDFADSDPLLPGYGLAVFVVEVDCVHELAVDVELLMEGCTVSDADGLAVAVAGEMAVWVS